MSTSPAANDVAWFHNTAAVERAIDRPSLETLRRQVLAPARSGPATIDDAGSSSGHVVVVFTGDDDSTTTSRVDLGHSADLPSALRRHPAVSALLSTSPERLATEAPYVLTVGRYTMGEQRPGGHHQPRP